MVWWDKLKTIFDWGINQQQKKYKPNFLNQLV